jgi:hypothetical protein
VKEGLILEYEAEKKHLPHYLNELGVRKPLMEINKLFHKVVER